MRYYEKDRFFVTEDNSGLRERLEDILVLEPSHTVAKIERKALHFIIRGDLMSQGLIDKPYYLSVGFVQDKQEIMIVVYDKIIEDDSIINFEDCYKISRDAELGKYYIEDNKEEN